MSVLITGVLHANAEKRTSVIERYAVVVLTIDVGPGFLAEARLLYREDHLRADAVALAARRGATVTLAAQGFHPRTDHSTAAIVMNATTEARIDGTPVFP